MDEHVWRYTRRGDKCVTVIIDLTAVRAGTGSAGLLDMVEGRSKQVFKAWLAARPKTRRDGVEVVAIDGFTGFETVAAQELPDAVAEASTSISNRHRPAPLHPHLRRARYVLLCARRRPFRQVLSVDDVTAVEALVLVTAEGFHFQRFHAQFVSAR